MSKFSEKKLNNSRGFTLIEIIIYVGIIGMVIFAFINFSISISGSSSRSFVVQEVDASSRFVLNKIKQKVRRAEGVVGPEAGSSSDVLVLDMPDPDPDTTFELRDGTLGVIEGVGDFEPLVSDNVRVTGLSFTNLDSGNSRIINVDFGIEYDNNSGNKSFDFSQKIRTAAEVKQ